MPSALYLARPRSASPYQQSTAFEDPLGGTFVLPEFDGPSPLWLLVAYTATISTLFAQRGVFAIWIAFGSGWWLGRFCMALACSAFLYGIVQLQLTAIPTTWKDIAVPFAALPLELVSLSAPLAAVAFWSGRRLRNVSAEASFTKQTSQFTIADILMLTALVGTAISLSLWKDSASGQEAVFPLPASIVWAAIALGVSLLYILPAFWAALAPRRLWLSIILLTCITVAYGTPLLQRTIIYGGFTAGAFCGLLLTIPTTLYIWRCCGNRLLAAKQATARSPRSAPPEGLA